MRIKAKTPINKSSSFPTTTSKMSDAFLNWRNDIFQRPNTNLPPNRFAIEFADGEIRRNCSWDQIMEICDQFKINNPSGCLTFNYNGFQCTIMFCLTQFNGYIQTTLEQCNWFDQNSELFVQHQPHGGITCGCALEGAPGFGFDCAHRADQQINPLSRNGPMMENPDGRQPTFKTPEFVEAELRTWANHLANILPQELRAPQL